MNNCNVSLAPGLFDKFRLGASANDFPYYSMAVAFTDRQLAADSAGSGGGHQINQRAHLNMDIDTLSGRSEVSFEIYLT